MKVTVNTGRNQYETECEKGAPLSDALLKCGALKRLPCGGNGTCGKCRALVDGAPVLACQTRVETDCAVFFPGEDSFLHIPRKEDPLPPPRRPLTGEKTCFCAALDIGSTTVEARLYSFPDGALVKSARAENAQTRYGADVLNRLGSFSREAGESLRAQIKDLLESFGEKIEKTVVCGNAVMLHFFAGLDTRGFAAAPYFVQSLFGEWRGEVFFPRCLGPFVGADLLCAVLASKMTESGKPALLADLGTNAEVALWTGERLLCASAAAGPAFEGGNITKGMPASDGAVEKVSIKKGKLSIEVIGGGEPRGICGSGLTDAIAAMLLCGAMDDSGYLFSPPFSLFEDKVFLTQRDIRAFQLAKSAVFSAQEILMERAGISPERIDALYICGGLGSSLSPQSAAAVGLIHKALAGRVSLLGNAALRGAALLLRDAGLAGKSDALARRARIIDLAEDEAFERLYIKNMNF